MTSFFGTRYMREMFVLGLQYTLNENIFKLHAPNLWRKCHRGPVSGKTTRKIYFEKCKSRRIG